MPESILAEIAQRELRKIDQFIAHSDNEIETLDTAAATERRRRHELVGRRAELAAELAALTS